MAAINAEATAEIHQFEVAVTRVGGVLARYGLVVVIGWIGLLKFAAYEAQGIAEIVYAPIGPDVPGELRAMREALG